MWSVASGAGEYSQASAVRVAVMRSLLREVLGTLVAARGPVLVLHEQVVEQRRGADAEAIRRQPVVAQRLLDQHELVDRLLAGADAAGGLEADDLARAVDVVAHRLEHDQRGARRGALADLAGRRLDEVRAALHRQQRGVADVVVAAELVELAEHLPVRRAGG